MEVLLGIVAGVIGLAVAIELGIYVFIGAAGLLRWAAQQQFVGVAAYFACWICLFPFMCVVCGVVGAIGVWSDRAAGFRDEMEEG